MLKKTNRLILTGSYRHQRCAHMATACSPEDAELVPLSFTEANGRMTTLFRRAFALDGLRVLPTVVALWAVKFAHLRACEGSRRS